MALGGLNNFRQTLLTFLLFIQRPQLEQIKALHNLCYVMYTL